VIGRAVACTALLILAGCSLLGFGQAPAIAVVTVNASDRAATLVVGEAGAERRLAYQPCSAHVERLEGGQPWRLEFNGTTIADSGGFAPLPDADITIVNVELHNDEASSGYGGTSDRMPDAPIPVDCDA
jgi:hypothetical protein